MYSLTFHFTGRRVRIMKHWRRKKVTKKKRNEKIIHGADFVWKKFWKESKWTFPREVVRGFVIVPHFVSINCHSFWLNPYFGSKTFQLPQSGGSFRLVGLWLSLPFFKAYTTLSEDLTTLLNLAHIFWGPHCLSWGPLFPIEAGHFRASQYTIKILLSTPPSLHNFSLIHSSWRKRG